jgi:hypothetical protein
MYAALLIEMAFKPIILSIHLTGGLFTASNLFSNASRATRAIVVGCEAVPPANMTEKPY